MTLIIQDRVLESSITTGVGDFTLVGAYLGYRSFASVCTVADTVWYYIEAIDSLGKPSGEYEYGLGTYSAANTLTRTTVRGSSNGGAAVNFTAGSKVVGISVLIGGTATRAEWLTIIGAAKSGANVDITGLGTLANINGGQIAGVRNRLINGAMAVDQRNSGAAQVFIAGAQAYGIDRWYVVPTGGNVTGQRVAGSGAEQYRYRITGGGGVTNIGFGQRIEKINSMDLAGSTVTLAVDLANSLLTAVTWAAYYANTDDTFGAVTLISTGSFTVNSTVTRYSTQIAVPGAATTGILVFLSVGAQTSGTWTIGNAQFELGSTSTIFERMPISSILSACQRYYFRKTKEGANAAFGSGYIYTATSYRGVVNFPVTMRAAPTLTTDTVTNFSAQAAIGNLPLSALSLIGSSTNEAWLDSICSAGTAGQGAALISTAGTPWIAFSSEL